LSDAGSKPSLIRRAASWLMMALEYLASFEGRRKAFVLSTSLGFSGQTELQMYLYGASRSPVSLPHPTEDRYPAKDIQAIIRDEAHSKAQRKC